jgi:succinyl-diaminopimelate desuccinylase
MELCKRIVRELVGIDSTFGNEAAIGRYVRGLFEHRGYRVTEQEIPGDSDQSRTSRRHNLIIERGNPRLWFFGHLDTVIPSPEQAAQWTRSPFEPVERDGRIYGLGAADMKSGVAAFLATVLESEPAHIGIALTCDEEGRFAGIKTLIDAGTFADRTAELAIFAEPTDLQIINTHRGCIEIEMAGHGRAAHAAMPDLGVDASRLYLCIDALRTELDASHPGSTLNIGYFRTGEPDSINVVPEHARAIIDIRPNASLQDVGAVWLTQRLEQLTKDQGLDLTWEINFDMSPLDVSPEELGPLVQAVEEADIEVRYADLRGTSEAGQIHHAYGFPCVNFGPGPMTMSHRVDEYVEIESLGKCKQVFERLVRSLGA